MIKTAPGLRTYDSTIPLVVITDASEKAGAGILAHITKRDYIPLNIGAHTGDNACTGTFNASNYVQPRWPSVTLLTILFIIKRLRRNNVK